MYLHINNIHEKSKRRSLRKQQTKEELKTWNILRNNKLGVKWRRQVSIGPYVADFYSRVNQLVIEIDGSQHLKSKEYDREREKYFLTLGIRTIRFWNNEINSNIEGVYVKIQEELRKPHPDPLLKGEGATSL